MQNAPHIYTGTSMLLAVVGYAMARGLIFQASYSAQGGYFETLRTLERPVTVQFSSVQYKLGYCIDTSGLVFPGKALGSRLVL